MNNSYLHVVPYTRFELYTAMKLYIAAFWVVARCSLVGGYQRFGETYFFQSPLSWKSRQQIPLKLWQPSAILRCIITGSSLLNFLLQKETHSDSNWCFKIPCILLVSNLLQSLMMGAIHNLNLSKAIVITVHYFGISRNMCESDRVTLYLFCSMSVCL